MAPRSTALCPLALHDALPIFPRMSYDDAMRRYGSDKPDIRFDLEIQDVSEAFRGSGFRVFDGVLEADGHIVAIVVPGMGDQGRSEERRVGKSEEGGGGGDTTRGSRREMRGEVVEERGT